MWKDNFEVIDFHSHILAGVDDGAPDLQTSLDMLSALSDMGVDKVVSTSHYYNSVETISSFISRRDEALYRLERHIKENDIYMPEIIPASEVRIYSGLWQEADLSRLCIGNSKCILLEMPYDHWSDWMFNEIYAINSKGFVPVMAHVERYIGSVPQKTIESSLLSLDVLVQCNTDFLESRASKKFVKRLLSKGNLNFLGSDCHNMNSRPPKMTEALEYVAKKFGEEYLKMLMQNAIEIVSQK
ncbi:MAG: hypothetical protein E7395_02390 [Ruminococcaceae bacterium]|nr:hypothetical protein [Oscillospiraceae bacterium]